MNEGDVPVALPSVRAVAKAGATIVAVLVGLGVVAAITRARAASYAGSDGLVALFHLDSELNVPAIAATLGLAACGVLLVTVAACLRTLGHVDAVRWRWLGFGFVYLAVDEGARIHERANAVVNQLGISLSALRFGWVLLGLVAVIALVPIYLPALGRMPADIRWLAVLAAALFVGGALGMELVGGLLYDEGTDSAIYQASVIVEEGGELAGVAVFFATLWRWWGRLAPRTVLHHAG